jgi:hypothetical protein
VATLAQTATAEVGTFIKAARCSLQGVRRRPIFFSHSRRGGEIVRGVEGQEFPNLEAAQAAATATVRELLADEIKHAKGPTLEAVIIADENGKELMTVRAKDILPEPLKLGRLSWRRHFHFAMRSDVACWHFSDLTGPADHVCS